MAAAASLLQASDGEADPTLCRRCQAFDIQVFSRNRIPWRGYRISDIADSAASGCPFCSYLARCLDDSGFRVYTMRRDGKQHWVHFTVKRAVQDAGIQRRPDRTGLNITRLQVFRHIGVGWGFSWSPPLLEFHAIADPDDLASTSGDVVGRYFSRNTGSQESVEVIKSWLAACEGHGKCSRTLSGQPIVTPTPSPTRCLEVTADPMAVGGMRIRLVETASTTGNYTTLSHRWPAPPEELHGATTSANLADRLACKEALESRLPRHFVDACMLTLRLGYEYIWIDAVCIIQGKGDPIAKADWIYEAAQMASYYQNSRLTIAAAYGDSTTGIFSAETPENSRPLFRLPYRPRPGRIAPQPSFFYLVPTDCVFNQDYDDHVIRSNLLSRGWVIQEWVLSRRILCYTPRNVYFQCMEEFPHNEDGTVLTVKTYETEEGGGTDFVKHFDKVYSSDLELKNIDLSRQGLGIYSTWVGIVEAYCRRNLTRPETDNLMGLVGIAIEFGRALADQFSSTEAERRIWVGGMWLSDILRGLLWEQVGYVPALELPTSSPGWHDAGRIAEFPSWSWASRRSTVQWNMLQHFEGGNPFFCEVMAVRDARAEQADTVAPATPTTSEGCAGGDWKPLYTVGVDSTKRFPVLCVRALLISVLIRENFTDEVERQLAAEFSGYRLVEGMYVYDGQRQLDAGHDPWREGRGRWRKVALPSSKERISGWVSLDGEQTKTQTNGADGGPRGESGPGKHREAGRQAIVDEDEAAAGTARGEANEGLLTSSPTAAGQQNLVPAREHGNGNSSVEEQEQETGRQQAMEEDDPGREAPVLLVLIMDADGGIPLGYMSLHHPVYYVLFLREYPDGATGTASRFERIGVGRLFGQDVQRLFEYAKLQELQLF